jgi:uncharacterized membrane protein YdjX (TVP38/TMEM64 family)
MGLKRYVLAVGAVFALFLVLFLLAEAWGVPLLADPLPQVRSAGVAGALLGVGLLMADVALPVPSSLVMIAHGAVFGVGLGTLLSLVGGTGATLVGFGLGRRGGSLLARFVSPQERATADRLLRRWGALAIIVTRPVPLLAETVAVLAGSSSLGWGKATLAALVGTLPPAMIYALAGTAPAGVGNGALVFIAVIAVAGGAWLAERRVGRWLGGSRDRAVAEPSSGTAS